MSIDTKQGLEEARRRREALVKGGCSTYILSTQRSLPVIVCLCCGLASYNLNDIGARYCGFCHEWHTEWREN